jgi:hypothetical protein
MVSARHLIGASIVISVAVAVGCATKPQAKGKAAPAHSKPTAVASRNNPSQPVAPGAGSAPVFEPVGPDGGADVADVTSHSLAQHSERYAKNLESLLSKRQHTGDEPTLPPAPADAANANANANEFPGFGKAGDTTTYSTLPPATAEHAEVPVARANTSMDVTARERGTEVEVPIPNRQARADARAAGTQAAPVDQPFPSQQNPDHQPPATQGDAEPAGAKTSVKAPAASAAAIKDDLLQKLAARVKDDPRDAVGHLNYQLLQFLLEEQVPELKSIAPLPAEDRELLTTLLDGLSNFRAGLRAEANSLQSKKVAPLLELADRLRSQGELTISTAALCSSVQRFGVYVPMEPPRFIAGGKNNAAILYCEVANFSSQLNDKKLWETKLKQEAVLYSESGLQVWSDKTDTVLEQSRNRLHDFFIADKVRLPASLPVGRYLMKMTVTDLQASRVAEATVPIQVVAQ